MKKILFTTALALSLCVPAWGQAVIAGSDFEAADFPPAGWSVADIDKDGHSWSRYEGNAQIKQLSGSKACAISASREIPYGEAYGKQDNWLVTPPFTVPNQNTVFRFSYAAQALEHDEPIEVLVATDGAEVPASFTSIWKSTASAGYGDDIEIEDLERSLAAYAGKEIRLAVRHTGSNTYALSVDNFYIMDNKGPKQPTAFAVTPGAGAANEAVLSWTDPSTDALGNPLGADLRIMVYRDGELVKTVTPQGAGKAETFTDTDVPTGRHTWTLRASNAAGSTLPTSARSAYVGPDIPEAVDAPIALALEDGTVSLRWTAPQKGANKGVIDLAKVTYKICRIAGGQTSVVAESVAATSFVDRNPVPGVSNIYWILAVNEAGESTFDEYTAAVPMGDGDMAVAVTTERDNSLARIPADINATYSVAQSIYYPVELRHATGKISALVFKAYKGNDSKVSFPVRIYLHETQATDLSAGWDKGLTDQSLVFQGNLALQQGTRDYQITFTTPYEYKGGNLVVTFIKDGKDSGAYSDRFLSVKTEGSAVRTYTGSVYSAVDGVNLPAFTYGEKKLAELPSTRFVMETRGVTAVSGTVTDAASSAPLARATVSVDGFDELSCLTGEDGRYAFPYVPVTASKLHVSVIGYVDRELPLALTEGTPATVDAAMTQNAKSTLSGRVIAEDTKLPAAGARIALSGYDEISVTADAEGNWSLSPVYDGEAYTLTVSYPCYDIHTEEVNITEDTRLPEISLARALITPLGVNAVVAADGSSVALNWQEPTDRDVAPGWAMRGEPVLKGVGGKDYYYNDYNLGHAYPAAYLAEKRLAGTSVTSVCLYLHGTQGTYTAKVWKGTRDDATAIAAKEIPLASIAEPAWVTVTFDEPVELRAGEDYIIGVNIKGAASDIYPIGTIEDYTRGVNNLQWSDLGVDYDGYYGWAIRALCEVPGAPAGVEPNADIPACEYRVYRRSADAPEWVAVTPTPIKETSYTDGGWATLVPGEYTYGVAAAYRNGDSAPARAYPLSRSVDTDVAVTAFVTPVKQVEMQSSAAVRVTVSNFGEKPVSDIPVAVTLNGGEPVRAVLSSTLNKGESEDFTVGTLELSEGVHTLRAFTELTGDQTPANDACEMTLPNMANIQLTGYRWNAYGNAGFMSIQSNNPEAATFLREVTPNDALIPTGEYVDGTVYGFTATWYGQPKEFVAIKDGVWTLESHLKNEDNYLLDMTMDHPAKTMYGLRAQGEDVYLSTVDLSDGTVTDIALLSEHLMTLAADIEGNLYGIGGDGVLYKVNPEDAAVTAVGPTGVPGEVRYLQSMAFDHNTGRLFWNWVGSHSDGTLCEVDPATGHATRLGDVLFSGSEPSEISILYTPYKYDGISEASDGLRTGLRLWADAEGRVTVVTASAAVLTVYDASGSAVARYDLPQGTTVVRPALSAGIYLLRATDGIRSAAAKAVIR